MNYDNNNRKQSKHNLQNEYEKIIKAEENLNEYKSTQKVNGKDVAVNKKNISYKNLSGRAVKEETIYNTVDKKPKKKKKWKITLSIISVLLIVLIGAGYYFIMNMLDGIQVIDDPKDPIENVDKIYDEDEFPIMHDPQNASTLNEYMETWYNNGGTKMYSKNVINALLMGVDNDRGTGQSRSDSIMLVSLNRKTKKISIISFMRDSYAYFKVGNDVYHTRINAAYFYGKAPSMVKVLENLYKIEIDYYGTIDFDSFSKMIDTIGGVTVEVQQYEAEYINRTSRHHIDHGPAVKLNGPEALVFSRIRHSDADSDVSRTRRQRQVVTALINSVKGASLKQIKNLINDVTPYITTNVKKTTMISLATKAVAGNWISFDIQQSIMPTNELLRAVTVDSQSVIAVDFPKAAQTVQNMIFGSSNIVLNENRINPLNLPISYSQGYDTTTRSYNNYTTSPYYNNNGNDEVITVPETTKAPTTKEDITYDNEEPSSDDSISTFE